MALRIKGGHRRFVDWFRFYCTALGVEGSL